MRLFASITKVDEEQHMVWGYASTEAQDRVGETVLKSAIDGALSDYLEFPTIREMHQLSAVGTTEEAEMTEKGLYIGARIVDDRAWEKVTKGVYKGFSIGGKALGRDPDDRTIITKVRLDEISLVDRPANPEARFDMWKAAGAEDGMADEKDETDDLSKTTTVVPDDAATAARQAELAEADAAAARAAALAKAAASAGGPPASEATTVAEGASEGAGDDGSSGSAAVEETSAEGGAPAVEEPTEKTVAVDPLARAEAAVSALEAVTQPEDAQKGMYQVSAFASIMSGIACLMNDAADEASWEGDNSPIPVALRDWLKQGISIFVAMAQEEATELVASMSKTLEAHAVGDVAKTVGSDDLQKAIAERDDALAKATSALEDLTKAVAERDAKLTDLADRVEKTVGGLQDRLSRLEASPAPARTAGPGHASITPIEKAADAGAVAQPPGSGELTDEDLQKALAAMSSEDRSMLLTKVALMRPIPVRTRSFAVPAAAE